MSYHPHRSNRSSYYDSEETDETPDINEENNLLGLVDSSIVEQLDTERSLRRASTKLSMDTTSIEAWILVFQKRLVARSCVISHLRGAGKSRTVMTSSRTLIEHPKSFLRCPGAILWTYGTLELWYDNSYV